MEDLRKSHNVKRRTRFSARFWWYRNKGTVKVLSIVVFLITLIIKPNLIGSKVGNWIDTLVSSFTTHSNITTHQWVVILGTILVGIICYKLIKWRNNS